MCDRHTSPRFARRNWALHAITSYRHLALHLSTRRRTFHFDNVHLDTLPNVFRGMTYSTTDEYQDDLILPGEGLSILLNAPDLRQDVSQVRHPSAMASTNATKPSEFNRTRTPSRFPWGVRMSASEWWSRLWMPRSSIAGDLKMFTSPRRMPDQGNINDRACRRLRRTSMERASAHRRRPARG